MSSVNHTGIKYSHSHSDNESTKAANLCLVRKTQRPERQRVEVDTDLHPELERDKQSNLKGGRREPQ